jgi:hypothetical protein
MVDPWLGELARSLDRQRQNEVVLVVRGGLVDVAIPEGRPDVGAEDVRPSASAAVGATGPVAAVEHLAAPESGIGGSLGGGKVSS